MKDKLKKVTLKGNASFNFREGWLRKGMRCIAQDPMLFTRDNVMEQLGVGSKMVSSIRFWLKACGLCEEKYINNSRARELYLTENFGEIVFQYDPYFDDIFTLFILHYHIVSNQALCIVWNIFFNEFSGIDFTKEDLVSMCSNLLQKKMEEGATFSEESLKSDCDYILKMYLSPTKIDDPEENLHCPLTVLGLIDKSPSDNKAYIKTSPVTDLLDKLAVLYVISMNIPEGRNSVSIRDLENAPNNIGHVFNLNRVKINEYLDELRVAGYVTINRTAGLDMVYLNNKYKPSDILIEYYKKAQMR
ncbi:DUF4007 family protein [Diplocloster modestus]|uniref:DUF4007 family protein n=1 Tax=Diplocloster modestus TaxID=2850322 RepID=A0ABS6KEE2_9FIRM|nr:DUF4007 family protein [Diplocloster modestus]MBU9728861.1 DUF4007 family protein [Diplocloster modestus]